VAAGGAVVVDVNIAARNRREAELSIALALFVILELTVFISVLNNTAMDLLVRRAAPDLAALHSPAGCAAAGHGERMNMQRLLSCIGIKEDGLPQGSGKHTAHAQENPPGRVWWGPI
jgi:hypothetical protein